MLEGFPPLARRSARALILGSMPGAASLRAQQYYAHPHNQFWPIVGDILGFDAALPYPRRVAALTKKGVAVWDVLKYCERPGSLDSSILRETEVPNDFARFFAGHDRVRAVFFNGGKAESAFRRHVLPTLPRELKLVYTRLPSTSPAHAGVSRANKLAAWRRIAQFL